MGSAHTEIRARVNDRGVNGVRFALVSDTHYGLNPARMPQIEPFKSSERTTQLLGEMAKEKGLDFWVHGGDVVDQGQWEWYAEFDRLARDVMGDLPCYVVPGNHDVPSMIRDYVSVGRRDDEFHDRNRMSYAFVRGPHHFLMIDGVDVRDPARAEVGKEGLEWIKGYIGNLPKGDMVWPICHFPVIQPTENVPSRMVLEDGAELWEILMRSADKVGFFAHGHLHIKAQYSALNSPHLLHISAPSGSFAFGSQRAGLGEDSHGVIGFEVIEIGTDGSWRMETRSIDVTGSRLT